MSRITLVTFTVVLAAESLIICAGNAFTIFVFWSQRKGSLKRTCYLLLNLAVIDLFVGATQPISLATQVKPFFLKGSSSYNDVHSHGYSFSAFFVAFSRMSVVSLAVISLERTFAVLCPFLHRTARSQVYFYSIAFVWAAGIVVATIYLFPAFRLWDQFYSIIAMNILVMFCVFTICVSYTVIRFHIKRSHQVFDFVQKGNMERNLKLSKTMFIVTALSFSCWIPSIILYAVVNACFNCVPSEVMWIGTVLHSGNSIVNPIAYSCRMPIFRKTLSRLLKKRQPENVELAQL